MFNGDKCGINKTVKDEQPMATLDLVSTLSLSILNVHHFKVLFMPCISHLNYYWFFVWAEYNETN